MILPPRIAPLGDAALTVTFAGAIDPEAVRSVGILGRALAAQPVAGLLEVVPGYVALTIHFDSAVTSFRQMADAIAVLATKPVATAAEAAGRRVEIGVRYDGPDLAEVAMAAGVSESEVVVRHSAPEYRVALLGFVPGFAYLGPIDPMLVLPRRASPRARVPAGSVAIAGAQTGVYPAETPGGWHLIGRTTAVLFDPGREPPALLAVGDRVRFVVER